MTVKLAQDHGRADIQAAGGGVPFGEAARQLVVLIARMAQREQRACIDEHPHVYLTLFAFFFAPAGSFDSLHFW